MKRAARFEQTAHQQQRLQEGRAAYWAEPVNRLHASMVQARRSRELEQKKKGPRR